MSKIIDMLIIWSVFIFLTILAIKQKKIKDRHQNGIIIFFIFFISIFMANRSLGLDLVNYQKIYEEFKISGIMQIFDITRLFKNKYEPLFNLEMYVAKCVGENFSQFMFWHIFIPQILLYFFVIKKTKNKIRVYSLFILLNLFKIDAARQYSSNILFIIALSSSKLKNYFIFSVLSISMHFSNLLTLVVKPFLSIKYTKKRFLMILIFALLGGVIVLRIISNFDGLNIITFKLKYYLDYNKKYYHYVNNIHRFFYYLNLYALPIFLIVFTLKNYNILTSENFQLNSKIINAQKLGIIFFCIIITIFNAPTMAIRIFDTFNIGLFLTLSSYMDLIKNRKLIHLYSSLFCFNFITSFYYLGCYTTWQF